MSITIMQWVAGNADMLQLLAAGIDARLHGCAVGGVSGDDVVMDVVCRQHDYMLTGVDDAHNTAIMRTLCYRRLVDVLRLDRVGSYAVDTIPATYDVSTALDSWGRFADVVQVMPASYFNVLTLHWIHGYSLIDCAGILGVSYQSVRGVYARSLAWLRRRVTA